MVLSMVDAGANHVDPVTGPERATSDTCATPLLLRTGSVVLTPLAVDDAPDMVSVLADASIYEFIGGRAPTLDRLVETYGRLAAGRSDDGSQIWHNWVVRRVVDEVAVGTVQATVFVDDDRADVAWIVGPKWQARGYASAAARAMVDWLTTCGVALITAHIHPDHAASAKVATNAGLVPTEEIHDGERRWVRRSEP